MILSCPFGKLGSFQAFGLSTNDKAVCTELAESELPLEFMDNACNLQKTLFNSNTDSQALWDFYETNCLGQLKCTIPVSTFQLKFSSACKSILDNRVKKS